METLRKDEKKEINEKLKALYGYDILDKKDLVSRDDHFLWINGECRFFKKDERWIPTLRFILVHPDTLKKVAVDMGAVRFVCSGADIMRPGIKEIDDDIKEGEIISIVECTHKKPLAIGMATLDAEGLKNAKEGKVIKNLHYVGDKIWKMGEKE